MQEDSLTAEPHEGSRHGVAPCAPVVERCVLEERIVARIDTLGALPDVVAETVRLADDPDATAGDLEAVVSRDPIVAGRLFKLANSTFFSRRGAVSTLPQAVRQLGFSTIKSLVLALSTGTVLGARLEAYDFAPLGLWDHSLAVALTSRSIARSLGLDRRVGDEVFLSGLLHDVGKLVLDPFLRGAYDGSLRLTVDHERATIAVDHAEVGARVARRWKLPDHTARVISSHHDPDRAGEFARHAGLVSLGDHLTSRTDFGRRPRPTSPGQEEPVPAATLDSLGLGEDDLPDLGASIRADLDGFPALRGMAA